MAARIEVRGKSVVTKREIEYATSWCLRRLLPHLRHRLSLNIYVADQPSHLIKYIGRNGVPYKRRMVDVGGTEVLYEKESAEQDLNRPRDFVVTLHDDPSRRALLTVLFHELDHVAQLATRKLRREFLQPTKGSRWKNRTVKDKNPAEYESWPWEVEARRMQKILIKAYERHLEKMARDDGITVEQLIKTCFNSRRKVCA